MLNGMKSEWKMKKPKKLRKHAKNDKEFFEWIANGLRINFVLNLLALQYILYIQYSNDSKGSSNQFNCIVYS